MHHYFHEEAQTFLSSGTEETGKPATMREHFEKYIEGVVDRAQSVVKLGDSPNMAVYGD